MENIVITLTPSQSDVLLAAINIYETRLRVELRDDFSGDRSWEIDTIRDLIALVVAARTLQS